MFKGNAAVQIGLAYCCASSLQFLIETPFYTQGCGLYCKGLIVCMMIILRSTSSRLSSICFLSPYMIAVGITVAMPPS